MLICQSIKLSKIVNMSTCQLVKTSIYKNTKMLICQNVQMSKCQRVNITICQQIISSEYFFVKLSKCQFDNISICINVKITNLCFDISAPFRLWTFKHVDRFAGQYNGSISMRTNTMISFQWNGGVRKLILPALSFPLKCRHSIGPGNLIFIEMLSSYWPARYGFRVFCFPWRLRFFKVVYQYVSMMLPISALLIALVVRWLGEENPATSKGLVVTSSPKLPEIWTSSPCHFPPPFEHKLIQCWRCLD